MTGRNRPSGSPASHLSAAMGLVRRPAPAAEAADASARSRSFFRRRPRSFRASVVVNMPTTFPSSTTTAEPHLFSARVCATVLDGGAGLDGVGAPGHRLVHRDLLRIDVAKGLEEMEVAQGEDPDETAARDDRKMPDAVAPHHPVSLRERPSTTRSSPARASCAARSWRSGGAGPRARVTVVYWTPS